MTNEPLLPYLGCQRANLRHNAVSMKSQPPLRLATFCVEASHALQGVVVDAVALNRVQLMPMPLQIIPSTGFPAERSDSYLAGCYSGSSEPPGY